MVIFGTLLTTLNKPMFAASGWVFASFGTLATLYWITAGKVFDRMSKGIREAPGKALIGDLAAASGDSPEGAFGLRQALATTGALLGSAIAGLAYKLSGQNYVLTFALAAAPAAAALVLTVGAFGPMAAESAAKKKQAAADEAAAVAAGEVFLDLLSRAKRAEGGGGRARGRRRKEGKKTHLFFKKKKKNRRQAQGRRPRRQVPPRQGQGPLLGAHPRILAGAPRRLLTLLRPLRRLVHHAARQAGPPQDAAAALDLSHDGRASCSGGSGWAEGQEVAQRQEQVREKREESKREGKVLTERTRKKTRSEKKKKLKKEKKTFIKIQKPLSRVLLVGYAAMVAADLTFAFAPAAFGMFAGAALVGVHMALTHGEFEFFNF